MVSYGRGFALAAAWVAAVVRVLLAWGSDTGGIAKVLR